MIDLDAQRVAEAAGGAARGGRARTRRARARGGRLARGRRRATCSSACPGERADGGEFARAALEAGAWGVLVAPAHARGARRGRRARSVIARRIRSPRSAALARAWRRELGCQVVGGHRIDGQDLDQGHPRRAAARRACATHASRENWNTEIGLPLTMLEAPRGTEALVLEMAMRGEGQIAELVAIAEPDVGVIVNVGPGAPRAARHGRARGRRQGRADPRPAPGRRLRGARPASRCSTPTCATSSTPGRSAPAAR